MQNILGRSKVERLLTGKDNNKVVLKELTKMD
jgi:hypothetical protein